MAIAFSHSSGISLDKTFDVSAYMRTMPCPDNPLEFKKKMRTSTYLLLALSIPLNALATSTAPIERVKISDNEMTCAQFHTEVGQMEKIIAEAKEIESSGQNTATAGQVGGVAADVASRTGLFGALGGLTGHLFGSIASKAAANVAEQSGQQTTQEAAERSRQALARKEHVTALFLNKGCKASDPNFEPKAGSQPPTKIAMATSPLPTAPLALNEVMRRAEGVTPLSVQLDLDNTNLGVTERQRVIVPGFRVAFVVKTVAQAYSGGALANFGNRTTSGSRTITQSQNKHVEMALAGADLPLLQAITDKLYADFIERVRATGKEVIDFPTITKTAGYEKFKYVTDKPYTVSPWSAGDPRSYIVMAPSKSPLWFMHIDSYLGNAGPFDQENTKAVHELCANLDAVALIPTLLVDIAEIESSGRSNFSAGAEADLLPKLGIVSRSELRYLNGKDAKIFFTGDFGQLVVKKPIYTEGAFGEIKTVQAFDTASLANVLTAATGLQGNQRFVEKRELKVDPEKFAAGAIKIGMTFNQSMLAALKQ